MKNPKIFNLAKGNYQKYFTKRYFKVSVPRNKKV